MGVNLLSWIVEPSRQKCLQIQNYKLPNQNMRKKKHKFLHAYKTPSPDYFIFCATKETMIHKVLTCYTVRLKTQTYHKVKHFFFWTIKENLGSVLECAKLRLWVWWSELGHYPLEQLRFSTGVGQYMPAGQNVFTDSETADHISAPPHWFPGVTW